MFLTRRVANFAQRIKDEFGLIRLAIRHPRTPRLARWVLLAAVGYALSPIDLIPDFIPVVGYLDDLLIVPLLLYIGWKLVPASVKQECRDAMRLRSTPGQNHLISGTCQKRGPTTDVPLRVHRNQRRL